MSGYLSVNLDRSVRNSCRSLSSRAVPASGPGLALGVGLRQLFGDRRAPLQPPHQAVSAQLQLTIQSLDRGEVDRELLGQLPAVTAPKLPQPLLFLGEPLLHLLDLSLEQPRGPGRLALAHFGVLVDRQGREHVRDVGDHVTVAAAIAEREGNGRRTAAGLLHALGLQPDVAPHPFDGGLDRRHGPDLGVEPELHDEGLEP